MNRRSPHHGMLLGRPDGYLYRVFAPVWWRLDLWAGWYAASAFEAARTAWRRRFGGVIRPAPARGYIEVHGKRVRCVSDSLVLTNVPRIKQ